MSKEPRLERELVARYFRDFEVRHAGHKVRVDVISSYPNVAFRLAVEVSQPAFGGAFPQRKFSLEKHEGYGHEGVHVQIWYHLVENGMNIGALYITLEIGDDADLLDVAEGFIYTAAETMRALGPEFEHISKELFDMELVSTLGKKKTILMERMARSLENGMMEIRRSGSKDPLLVSTQDIRSLLGSRTELTPFLGPLVTSLPEE